MKLQRLQDLYRSTVPGATSKTLQVWRVGFVVPVLQVLRKCFPPMTWGGTKASLCPCRASAFDPMVITQSDHQSRPHESSVHAMGHCWWIFWGVSGLAREQETCSWRMFPQIFRFCDRGDSWYAASTDMPHTLEFLPESFWQAYKFFYVLLGLLET